MKTLLLLLNDGKPAHVLSLGAAPVQIGRSPANDLALGDVSLSRHHASVWTRGSSVWIADHGSTNGTQVNGVPVEGAMQLGDGDMIQLGNATFLKVKRVQEAEQEHVDCKLVLHDLAIGVRRGLFVGENELDGRCTLIVGRDGRSVTLTEGRRSNSLAVDHEFQVDGRTYRIEAEEVEENVTGPLPEETDSSFAYSVFATLNGASGAETRLQRLSGGEPTIVNATPAVLLFILAKQLEADLGKGTPSSIAGWCSDDDIRRGIWGRDVDHSSNTLNVLLYRTRRELEKAGYNGGCIEKKRRATRLCVVECRTE
jgi:hypothetical protein